MTEVKERFYQERVWGSKNVSELEAYMKWMHDHPHCTTPREPGPTGPKANQKQDDTNPSLYYTDYSQFQPKLHSLLPSNLGVLGNFREVTAVCNDSDLRRKKEKRRKDPTQPWESPLVADFMDKYHVKGGNALLDTYPVKEEVKREDVNVVVVRDNEPLKYALRPFVWPEPQPDGNLAPKILPRKKVSPWAPKVEETRYTRDGTFLRSFQEMELNKKIDEYLAVFSKSTERKKKPGNTRASSRLRAVHEDELLTVHEEVSRNVAEGIEKLLLEMKVVDFMQGNNETIVNALATCLELDEACFRGNVTQVSLLVGAGASPHAGDHDQSNPLFNRVFERALALHADHSRNEQSSNSKIGDLMRILDLLLGHGAQVNGMNIATTMAPVHRAAIVGNETLLRFLMDHGADINLTGGKDALTPAQFAGIYGHVACLAAILREYGLAPALTVDAAGRNTLHLAAAYGQRHTALFLLSLGMDKRTEDKERQTPGDLAWKGGFKDTSLLIKRFNPGDDRVLDKLQYLTDHQEAVLALKNGEEDSINSRSLSEDKTEYASFSTRVLQFAARRTSTLSNIMTYLYKSLKIKSEKAPVS